MKLNIINKIEKKLFNRTEIEFEVEHSKAPTPTRVEIKKGLSSQLNSKPELVSLRKINSLFGLDKSKGLAYVYKSKEYLEKFEPKFFLKRGEPKEKKSPEEQPQEAVPETPKEEVEEKKEGE